MSVSGRHRSSAALSRWNSLARVQVDVDRLLGAQIGSLQSTAAVLEGLRLHLTSTDYAHLAPPPASPSLNLAQKDGDRVSLPPAILCPC